MPDSLTTGCIGRIVGVDSACGCTLTATKITGLTGPDIVALADKEIALTKAILDAREAKMLGCPENPLMELLNSRIKDVKGELTQMKVDGQSIVQPFIYRPQSSFINANYFLIKSGTPQPNPAGQTPPLPLSSFILTLGLGNSPFQSPLQAISRYFVPGMTLIVRTWDSFVAKNARTLVFTVISATEADVGSTPYAQVVVYAPVSDTNWAGYSSGQKAVWQPTFGLAEIGANSISDYESYCNNQPSDLARNLVLNWLQTSRESYCREASYEETLDWILKGKVNDYLAGFVYMSIAAQQKQMKAAYDRAWFNSVFFGQPIDVDNQTEANWRNLPLVYDVGSPTCPLAYKANALGIFTLLNACNRVVDLQGMPLNLNQIFSAIYYLRRFREATGDRVPVIDSFTDRFTKSDIFEAMTKYYKARYSWDTTRYFTTDQKITHDGMIMFVYDVYDIPEAGCQWSVFQLDYFNDLLDACNSLVVGWQFNVRAKNLWFVDWSDVNIGVAGQRQVSRKSPDPATELPLYQCVIKPNVRTYDLRSKDWTVMVDRPNRHLIYHNFAWGCPQVEIPGCTVPMS